MMWGWWEGTWLLALDWIIRLAALVVIPIYNRPAAARSWLLLLGFVPLLGLPLYLWLGHPWVSGVRVRHQKYVSQVIREEQHALTSRWQPSGDAVTELVPLVEKLGDFIPTDGNAVQLLDDYDGALQALLKDIAEAKQRVHLLYYLMFNDAVGEAVCQALVEAAGRGVKCRVLLDAMGARRGLRHYRKRLLAAGVEVHAMLPGGLRWQSSGRWDLRNHRKITVIDNEIGYVGSQNLASADFVKGFPNKELVARVHGPAVIQLEAVFASDWYMETGGRLAILPPIMPQSGGIATQLLPSGPAYPFSNARDTINAMIHLAKRKIVLVTPYFVPDDATLNALRIAALSGVEVLLIVSERNNQRLTAFAQQSYYDELLSCGVEIRLYRPHFLHAKHVSVDDDIALIGSINMDIRSFALNAEIGLMCYSKEMVRQLRKIEGEYLGNSTTLDLAQWRKRAGWRRSCEGVARLADALL